MLLFDYEAGLVKPNFYPPSKCFHVSCSLLPLTWFCAIICLSMPVPSEITSKYHETSRKKRQVRKEGRYQFLSTVCNTKRQETTSVAIN